MESNMLYFKYYILLPDCLIKNTYRNTDKMMLYVIINRAKVHFLSYHQIAKEKVLTIFRGRS